MGWGGQTGGQQPCGGHTSPELTDEGLPLIRGPQPVAPGEEGVGVSLVEPGQVSQVEAQPLLFREGWQPPLDSPHPCCVISTLPQGLQAPTLVVKAPTLA